MSTSFSRLLTPGHRFMPVIVVLLILVVPLAMLAIVATVEVHQEMALPEGTRAEFSGVRILDTESPYFFFEYEIKYPDGRKANPSQIAWIPLSDNRVQIIESTMGIPP